ncbi:MAG: tetratricopeptide repeat protein [Candidatus Hodarchaeota archaeon]
MTNSSKNDLARSKQFISEGKYDEALQILESLEKQENSSSNEQLLCYLLKGALLNKTGRYEESLKLAENALKESLKLKKDLWAVDAIISILEASWNLGKHETTLDLVEQGEDILRSLAQDQSSDIISRKGTLLYQKGNIFVVKGDLDQALELLRQSLNLLRKTNSKEDIANCLNGLGRIFWQNGDWTRAIEHIEEALTLFQELGNKQRIATSRNHMGVISMFRGDLDKSLEYFQQNLILFEELNDRWGLGASYANIAWVNWQKGNIDQSLGGFEKSLEIFQELSNGFYMSQDLFYMICITVQENRLKQADQWLQQFEQLDAQEENKLINQRYRVSKALILKKGKGRRKESKAKEILEQVIEEEVHSSDLTAMALLHLCEMLLNEIQSSKSPKVLENVHSLVDRLQETSKKFHSHWFFAESIVLKSKLALLELDVQQARRLLTQAELIAEERDLKGLAIRISIEHDALLDQLKTWEELKERDAPLAERARVARVKEFLGQLIRKRIRDIPLLQEEEPALLLIIHKDGVSLFSTTFGSTDKFDDLLLGAFLTAIQAMSTTVFAQEIDRLKFKKYTLLMKSVESFQLWYAFKGQTYPAQQKLTRLINNMQSQTEIVEALKKAGIGCTTLEGPEKVLLENLLSTIFYKN